MAGLDHVGTQLKPVAVIGGGCAGLATAFELARHGIAVTLFESSSRLGGRARSISWQGRQLDNGQHILLGAYHETLRLLDIAGVNLAQALLRLPLHWVQSGQLSLRAPSWLPAPLHLLAGLLTARGLGFPEKLAALRFMTQLHLQGFRVTQDEPLKQYLARQRQPDYLVRWLWEPLCLAVLNTPLSDASTQVFLNVLRDSFTRARHDSDLLLPRQDLSTLLADPLAEVIRRQGSDILTGTTINRIRPAPAGYHLTWRGGSAEFRHVVLAVAPFHLPLLLADSALPIPRFSYQPIATLYLQYSPSTRLPLPMLGLSGGLAQWVFDRGQLSDQHGLLAVVISAAGSHMQMHQQKLAETVAHELAQAFPHLPGPHWHKVIIEKRATFACVSNLQRPPNRTELPGLWLAGDYTEGPYPATIEGAVRSGVQCAQSILQQ